jgi:hypothetical protein
MARPVTLVIGGPWYRSTVDARLLSTIVSVVTEAPRRNFRPLQISYQDGLLDLARNRLMTGALRTGADWLVSFDSDCSLVGDHPGPLFDALSTCYQPDIALVAAPARCADGRWNVQTLDGEPWRLGAGREQVACIGFGLVAFRLGWYAKHWPADIPYFQTVITPDAKIPLGWAPVGEDYGHCHAVRNLGGRVVCAHDIALDHHVTRAGSWAERADQRLTEAHRAGKVEP